MFDPDKDSEKEDFFNSPVPEERPKPPKKPEYKPDDPKYWDQEESEWEHLKPRRRTRFYLLLAGCGVILGLLLTAYFYWFSPAVEEATAYGYVEKVDKEGLAFKTYEGVILPYREMMDTTRVYREDFPFSTADENLAVRLKQLEGSGYPVRVEYKRFRGSLPWRGSSHNIITRVDTAEPRKLLPPEFRPGYIPDRPYRKALKTMPDSARIVAGNVSDPEPEPKNEAGASQKKQSPAPAGANDAGGEKPLFR